MPIKARKATPSNPRKEDLHLVTLKVPASLYQAIAARAKEQKKYIGTVIRETCESVLKY